MVLEYQILEFIVNRHQVSESTTFRHIHRRFDLDYENTEKIITNLLHKDLIYKFYDEEYEEYRFLPN